MVHRVRAARDKRSRHSHRGELHDVLDTIRGYAPAVPPTETLDRLFAAWSNDAAGDTDYLRVTIERAVAAEKPILECGSGLTTLLLAIYSNQPVLTLESHEEWHRQVHAELDRLGEHPVRLVHAPLVQIDDFHWYDVRGIELPAEFGLVVCDGPPCSQLPGGRVGLLPVIGDRLPAGAVVFVDEHMQQAETAALDRWISDYGFAEVSRTPSVLTLQRQ